MTRLGHRTGNLVPFGKVCSVPRLLSIISRLVTSILSSPVFLRGSLRGQILYLLVILTLAALAFAIVSELFHFLSVGLYPLQPAL